MCFSAAASFAGGAVVTAIGVATVRKAKTPSQVPFASIPLIFGIQQIAEGFVWLSLQSPGSAYMLKISTYAFLIAAVIIWPVMLPLSIMLLEESAKRRKALKVFLGTGILTTLYYGTGLVVLDVRPEILGHHIFYAGDYPKVLVIPFFILYAISTITPLFVSSVKRMYIFGILITVSCLVSGIFYTKCLTSVWCFFAALISVFLYLVMRDMEMKKE